MIRRGAAPLDWLSALEGYPQSSVAVISLSMQFPTDTEILFCAAGTIRTTVEYPEGLFSAIKQFDLGYHSMYTRLVTEQIQMAPIQGCRGHSCYIIWVEKTRQKSERGNYTLQE